MKTFIALAAFVILATSTAFSEAPTPGKDMSKAIHQATRENKMAFILMGRENCGNCNATKKMISEGKVPVTSDTFVMADINCDDERISADFNQKFSKEKFGNTLPFVVITDSKGKALASYSGYKSPADLTAIIEGAKAKAESKVKK